jgi:molybdopterin converting factor small subunit
MSLVVRLPAPLRATVGGQTTIPIDATDLRSLPNAISERYPELASRVVRDGAYGRFVVVFVDGEDARYLPGETTLASARVIEILPAVSGG